MEPKGARAYVAELVGTFVLVTFIGFVVSLTSRSALGFTDWAVIGLVHAFVLALLVASLAGVCGAHFNPAVSISLAATKKIRGADAAVYILMQLAGATLAALFVKGLLLDEGKPVRGMGLSEEDRASIERGRAQARAGQLRTTEEVFASLRTRA